uniref:RNA-binding protein 7 n=1 Tax=Podarcis muralis TaxID=64176 RepID=A0A670JXP8_PODMU
MGAAAAEADRTLFVGNLDPKVTEELLFELFHQAGPVIKVKIPKDRDGKPKQFAFVNFKHEESVPYGMDLLNGIKLFGRPLKIQFRSGSSHASQDNNSPYSQPGYANGSPSSIQQLPTTTASSSRYERNVDNISTESPTVQRSFSSPDNLQRQAVMNNMWQQSQYSGRHNSLHPEPSGFASPGHHPSYSFTQSSASSMQWRSETSAAQRKNRMTGLDIEKDQIIEMACLITDSDLNILAESGLTKAVQESKISLRQAEYEFLSFVRQQTPPGLCPLAGNSVHADKKFLDKHMPQFMKHLHYRIIDVSTIKELCRRWYPEDYEFAPKKAASHRRKCVLQSSSEVARVENQEGIRCQIQSSVGLIPAGQKAEPWMTSGRVSKSFSSTEIASSRGKRTRRKEN